jgi:hypothetical protein
MEQSPLLLRVLSFDVGIRNHAMCLLEWGRGPGVTSNDDTGAGGVDLMHEWWRHVRIVKWSCVDVTETASKDGEGLVVAKNVKTMPMNKKLRMLLSTLDASLRDCVQNANISVNSIVIESQPKCNPQMKQMSASLFAWCHLRIVETRGERTANTDLDFYSPSRKGLMMREFCTQRGVVFDPDFKKKAREAKRAAKPPPKKPRKTTKAKPVPPPVIEIEDDSDDDDLIDDSSGDDDDDDVVTTTTTTSTTKTKAEAKKIAKRRGYTLRKGESEFACQEWLKVLGEEGADDEASKTLRTFEGSKKKDDLADAFWQGMHAMKELLEKEAKRLLKLEKAAASRAAKAKPKAAPLSKPRKRARVETTSSEFEDD